MDDERNEKLTREEQELEDIESYLSGVEPGYTVIIQRLEPAYAKGLLDEISVDATTNPINLHYLINTWGGHKLRLKFRRPNGTWAKHRDINMYSFPPLLYGQRIEQEISPHLKQENTEPYQPHYAPPPPPQNSDKKEMLEMMALMQKMRSDDLQTLGQLVQQQRTEPPPPQQPQLDPMRMLQGAFSLFSQFQQIKSPQAESGENDEILGLLGKAVDVFASNNKTPTETRIVPPVSQGSPDEILAGMEPVQAIQALKNAAAQMDPDKQAQLMSGLLGSIDQIGGTDLLLDQLEQRGILPEYAEDDSEDDDGPDSRGEHGSNESDNTPRRAGH